MTEQTLEQANEIKRELDNGRELLRGLEELQAMCCGNEAEVEGRKFYVEVRDNDRYGKKERVTPEAAKAALNKVIEEISEEIREMKSKLDELH